MKSSILIQLDTDPHPSVFDAVVAIDSGVDHLLQYSGITTENVESLVHGAIFTRGPEDLPNTALFVGGSDVQRGEEVLEQINRCFFGPMRVSVMMDVNGANTTAAAAVLAAERHLPLSGSTFTVLAATGPVGNRIVYLLSLAGAQVRVVSRSMSRAEEACRRVRSMVPDANLTPMEASTLEEVQVALRDSNGVFAAGAGKVQLVDGDTWRAMDSLQVAIDLNAVPPAGIEGIELNDKAEVKAGVTCYGPIGVGGTKMKIHREALRRLYTANNLVLNAAAIYEIGKELETQQGDRWTRPLRSSAAE